MGGLTPVRFRIQTPTSNQPASATRSRQYRKGREKTQQIARLDTSDLHGHVSRPLRLCLKREVIYWRHRRIMNPMVSGRCLSRRPSSYRLFLKARAFAIIGTYIVTLRASINLLKYRHSRTAIDDVGIVFGSLIFQLLLVCPRVQSFLPFPTQAVE